MQIELGIPLIIIGFLIPVVLYILFRWYQNKKARDRMLQGEIFDKEGERLAFEEEGNEIEIDN